MQYQGIDEQLVVNKGLAPIARELNMPLVATNDVHYLTHGDHRPHDILLVHRHRQERSTIAIGCGITAISSI